LSARPGPGNSICDVAGVRVGQAHDERVRSGVTVILPDSPCVCAVDARGGGPGTRETDALAAENLVETVHGLVFAGGSVYGLAAADAVCAWLGAQGIGFRFDQFGAGIPAAPVVPAAILFDLANGGHKAWGEAPPYGRLGREAAEAAGETVTLGRAGAGFGAMAGALAGGIGSASIVTDEGFVVGALAAVNSFGSVLAGDGQTFWASPFEIGDEFGGRGTAGLSTAPDDWGLAKAAATDGRTNTTLACIALDADLTKAEAKRVAVMAQDGLARAIRPAHAPFDGDVVFVLATGAKLLPEPRPLAITRLGAHAADVLARAIARGVYWAQTQP
jgi:L-aminopeptidase/D-esterase-like protein